MSAWSEGGGVANWGENSSTLPGLNNGTYAGANIEVTGGLKLSVTEGFKLGYYTNNWSVACGLAYSCAWGLNYSGVIGTYLNIVTGYYIKKVFSPSSPWNLPGTFFSPELMGMAKSTLGASIESTANDYTINAGTELTSHLLGKLEFFDKGKFTKGNNYTNFISNQIKSVQVRTKSTANQNQASGTSTHTAVGINQMVDEAHANNVTGPHVTEADELINQGNPEMPVVTDAESNSAGEEVVMTPEAVQWLAGFLEIMSGGGGDGDEEAVPNPADGEIADGEAALTEASEAEADTLAWLNAMYEVWGDKQMPI